MSEPELSLDDVPVGFDEGTLMAINADPAVADAARAHVAQEWAKRVMVDDWLLREEEAPLTYRLVAAMHILRHCRDPLPERLERCDDWADLVQVSGFKAFAAGPGGG